MEMVGFVAEILSVYLLEEKFYVFFFLASKNRTVRE